jgi:hypothetical protein
MQATAISSGTMAEGAVAIIVPFFEEIALQIERLAV